MRELREILDAFHELTERGETAVLASLVHASGSTYRRPGARMLIRADGSFLGLLSGGCLEGDLVEHAARVRREGQPTLVHYDATVEDDMIWGLGLGCAGRVEILLEPIDATHPGPLRWLEAWLGTRTHGAMATDLSPERLGQRVAFDLEAGCRPGPGAEVDPELEGWLRDAVTTGRGRRFEREGRDLAIEEVAPPLRLVVFGAGPDAGPVVRLAQDLGWETHVADGRPAYARAEAFPGARVVCAPADEAVASVGVDADTFALVMTHHYLHDRALLASLLPGPAAYIGLLGPKARADDLLADLEAQGAGPEDGADARLHAPAGLDLGGEGPEAIALALIAEVQAYAAGRSGGWLRDRKGPIHDPDAG